MVTAIGQCMSVVLLGIFFLVLIANMVREYKREIKNQPKNREGEDVVIQPHQHKPRTFDRPNLKVVK